MPTDSTTELWATREQISQICPDCARRMESLGIDRLRINEAIPAQMKAGLCQSLGGDEGFFRRCMSKSFGDFNPGQKENFCAWLHKECIGKWPGTGRRSESRLVLEAKVEKSGREWEVTIIGAQKPDDIVTINGRTYLKSLNKRLYDVAALEATASDWEGIQVYDNHLTNDEYMQKQGMRSVSKEWLGTIIKPRWDKTKNQLRATLKVVEDQFATKLKNAFEQGILSTIGLSVASFPAYGTDIFYEGDQYKVVEGFDVMESVDVVTRPAAGGRFERLLASIQKENMTMSEETNEELITMSRDDFKDLVKAEVADALAAKEAETKEKDLEEMDDEEILKAKEERDEAKASAKVEKLAQEARKLQNEAALARTDLLLTQKLDKAKLPPKFEDAVRVQFEGRVVEAKDIDRAIELQREAWASMDPSGRVKAGGISDVSVGMDDNDKFGMAMMRILMGESELRALEANEDEDVNERLLASSAYQAWLKAGKPNVVRYPKMSSLLYDFYSGDPLLDARLIEAASTSSLTTVVKNTVNIMAANSYSQREMWWEPIVTVHEVDTIDDATLARVYGTDELPTIEEGGVYTEISLDDEEETASFVKRGGYIGITLETLMRDKISYVRRIPQGLADAWYNTQADLVANVFTVNTAAGPALADGGALFNNTAATSATGHANLLTSALSHANFAAVRTAMMKQTDQPLGDGRRLAGANVPRWLLVPVDLETTALEIRNSELVPGQIGGHTSAGEFQTRNLYAGTFDVIVVPPWTDTNNWAAVSALPAIHLVYPRGQRTPQIYTADAENAGAMFTNDTLRFKTRLMTYRFSATYDCAPVSDWRPLHKSNV